MKCLFACTRLAIILFVSLCASAVLLPVLLIFKLGQFPTLLTQKSIRDEQIK